MAKWSTEIINDLLKRYEDTAVMPKTNPFHSGNKDWRKGNISYSYTKEEMLELAKCRIDILHFAEKHCTVMTDDGIRNVKMRPYQRKVLLQFKKYRFNVYLASRQIGKEITTLSEIHIETLHNEIYYNLKMPLFELYYETKKRNTEGLSFIDKIKRSLYRKLCRLEGNHKYLYSAEWYKFTSDQNTSR